MIDLLVGAFEIDPVRRVQLEIISECLDIASSIVMDLFQNGTRIPPQPPAAGTSEIRAVHANIVEFRTSHISTHPEEAGK